MNNVITEAAVKSQYSNIWLDNLQKRKQKMCKRKNK